MPERSSPDALLWKALLVAAALWLLYLSLSFVVVTLVALMLAAALLPLAEAAQRRRVPRIMTVVGMYAVGIAGLTLLIALLVPVVMDQGRQLVAKAPQYRQQALGWVQAALAQTARWGGPATITLPEIGLKEVGPVLQELGRRSVQATRGLFSGTISALLVLFVAAYIVIDSRGLADGLLGFVPPARRPEAERVGRLVMERMGGYVRGQLSVSLCIATLLSIGLAIMRVDTPVLIGVTAGALNFVPFLGSTVALLLAVLVAANNSLLSVLGVLLLFGGVQFLEGKVLVPYLLGRKVALHPLAVLAALVVGAHVAGLIGAVVAVPILAGANAVVQETWVRGLARR
jgi:predicted PurR-regulated permease PerM